MMNNEPCTLMVFYSAGKDKKMNNEQGLTNGDLRRIFVITMRGEGSETVF